MDDQDYLMDDDPTLSACCIRDLQDRKQAAAWKAELKSKDPVERAEARYRAGAGILSNGYQGPQATHRVPSFPKGQYVETSECDVSSIVSSGQFVVCLAMAEGSSQLENSIKNWIDGFDSILLGHRFRPVSCRNCFLNENLKLPALVIWNKGKNLLTLERSRLEAENEGSLIGRLTLIKRQASETSESEEEEDEDERTTGRSSFFKCEKAGCTRTFHHVHVQNTWKNSAFQTREEVANDESDDEM